MLKRKLLTQLYSQKTEKKGIKNFNDIAMKYESSIPRGKETSTSRKMDVMLKSQLIGPYTPEQKCRTTTSTDQKLLLQAR